jgi:hypothetical protein
MSSVTQNPEAATDWQQEIRALEGPNPPHHGRGRDRADRPLRRTP